MPNVSFRLLCHKFFACRVSLQSATAAGICPGWRASESPFSFGFRSFSLPFLFYFLVLFFSCFFVFCFHFYYSLSAFLFFAYFSFLFLSALEMCLREKSRLSTRLAFGSVSFFFSPRNFSVHSPIAMLWGLAKLKGGRAPSGHRQSWWADGVPVMF